MTKNWTKLEVQVTTDDINEGLPATCDISEECAIAVAVKKYLQPNIKVYISGVSIVFCRPGKKKKPEKVYTISEIDLKYDVIYSELLPEIAIDFIEMFDNMIPVSPFKFSINIPEELITEGFGYQTLVPVNTRMNHAQTECVLQR